jgi:hypothetical protein
VKVARPKAAIPQLACIFAGQAFEPCLLHARARPPQLWIDRHSVQATGRPRSRSKGESFGSTPEWDIFRAPILPSRRCPKTRLAQEMPSERKVAQNWPFKCKTCYLGFDSKRLQGWSSEIEVHFGCRRSGRRKHNWRTGNVTTIIA